MGNMYKKRIEGYMTLEATFVVMIAACIIGCVIYAGLFCYTSVFYKQNCYLAALRGSNLLLSDEETVSEHVEKELRKLTGDYFFKLEKEGQNIRTDYLSITVSKFAEEILFLKDRPILEINQEAAAKRLYPARTIRTYERSKREDA